MATFNWNKSRDSYLNDYYEKLKELQKYQLTANPGQYNSPYYNNLQSTMKQIQNYGPFEWNPDVDEAYQAYKQNRMRLGQRAMRDTMAQAAALTGGYGNSYGATAAASMYNQYADDAANKMADYEDRAYSRWGQGKQDLYYLLDMYRAADDTAYGRHRDDVADYQAMLNYLTGRADTLYDRGINAYNTDYGNAYTRYRDLTADEQRAAQLAEEIRQYNESLAWDKQKYADNMAWEREQYQRSAEQAANELAYKYASLNAKNSGTKETKNEETGSAKKGASGAKKEIRLDVHPDVKTQIQAEFKKANPSLAPNKGAVIDNIADKYIAMGFNANDIYEYLDSLMRELSKPTTIKPLFS